MIMNITTIYREMESKRNVDLNVYFAYLSEHVNSSSFDVNEVLRSDKKYLRSFSCAALSVQRSDYLSTLISKDKDMPVFTSHMALIKCSFELLNIANSETDLEQLLNNVINGIRFAKIDRPGTTLSFAFGHVLGTAVKRGINAKSFLDKFDSKFIINNERLFSGFISGLQDNNLSLLSNQEYINDLCERYDNWESVSQKLSLSIFKAIPIQKLNGVHFSENNLSVLNYFSGRNQSYDDFLSSYKKKLTVSSIKESSDSDSEIKPMLEKSNKQSEEKNKEEDLNKIISNQQMEISSLNEQLKFYQDIFKQFEILFPDLQKTLQSSENDKELLSKIKKIVHEQQQHIQELHSYQETVEKQKSLKEGIKKIL